MIRVNIIQIVDGEEDQIATTVMPHAPRIGETLWFQEYDNSKHITPKTVTDVCYWIANQLTGYTVPSESCAVYVEGLEELGFSVTKTGQDTWLVKWDKKTVATPIEAPQTKKKIKININPMYALYTVVFFIFVILFTQLFISGNVAEPMDNTMKPMQTAYDYFQSIKRDKDVVKPDGRANKYFHDFMLVIAENPAINLNFLLRINIDQTNLIA